MNRSDYARVMHDSCTTVSRHAADGAVKWTQQEMQTLGLFSAGLPNTAATGIIPPLSHPRLATHLPWLELRRGQCCQVHSEFLARVLPGSLL